MFFKPNIVKILGIKNEKTERMGHCFKIKWAFLYYAYFGDSMIILLNKTWLRYSNVSRYFGVEKRKKKVLGLPI